MVSFRLTGPLTDDDFLLYYEKIKSDPDFYAEKFGEALFSDKAYRDLAGYLTDYFSPQKAIDVGCGKGQMVEALLSKKVDASGLDWSQFFFQSAPSNLMPYLRCCDLLTTEPEKNYDLVICMEMLEHFPPAFIPKAISFLRGYCKKNLFVTIPSFGPNPHGPSGIQVINPEWQDDAKNDRYFRYIVVDNHGIPHHGHLTLATYRWWTRQFIKQGLIRIPSLEKLFYTKAGALINEHHWNVYILQEITSPIIDFDMESVDQLGNGWYDRETFLREGIKTGVRWTERKAICYLKNERPARWLNLNFYGGPIQLLYDFELYISVYDHTADTYIMKQQPVSVSPDTWYKKRLDIGDIPTGIFQVTLELTDGWISKNYTNFDDPRELGVAVHSISVTPE